jgi:hypothetical protein
VTADAAEQADLALGAGIGNSDGGRVFVDIQSDVEFNRFHGVVDRVYSHDESERISPHDRERSCGSAHPGNPVPRLWEQPHHFLQSQNYGCGARRQP